MLDIKELTMNNKNAERQEFVKILMSGEIDENYITYLYNQFQCYAVLEKYVYIIHCLEIHQTY